LPDELDGAQVLLARFLQEEVTTGVRAKICDLVATRPKELTRHEFNFNVFDLLLDFEDGVAVIHDILAGPEDTAGTERVPIGSFLSSLDCPPSDKLLSRQAPTDET